jgi:hypothetical protein
MNLLEKYLSTEQNKNSRQSMDGGKKRRRNNKKNVLFNFDLSFCLRDYGVTPCPFGIRAERTSPDCHPSAVFVIHDTREYYPFGKALTLSPADFI